jgi:hypothetical protein
MMRNNIKFFLFVTFVCVQLLSAMNREIVPLKIETEKILQKNKFVLDLVSKNYLLNHEAICSFAATNKSHNADMIFTAQQRKNLLLKSGCILLSVSIGTIWHKYGSAYSFAYKKPGVNVLILGYYALKSEKRYKSITQSFQGFISPLSYKPAPFFNDKGGLSFYGYGEKNISYEDSDWAWECHKTVESIMRYSLDNKCLRCVLNTTMNNHLMYFLEYSVLLKAILKINTTKEIKIDSEEYLEYSLKNIVIPNDYAKRTVFPHLVKKYSTESFDDVPYCVEQTIRNDEKILLLKSKK